MAAMRRKRGLVLLAMLFVALILPIPVNSQDHLNQEHLSLMDNLTVADWGITRTGESAQTQPAVERVELPAMANPFAINDALVLVRLNRTSVQRDQLPVLAEIYFDAKRYFLKREAAQIIEESARILGEDKTRKLQVEALCDKRGTTAYSLALGSHRAYAVTRYLHNLGIPSSQISATSFGTHQHPCEASSSACWQDTLRIDHAFYLLAMNHPQSGCLIRLRLNPGLRDQTTPEHVTRQPFLQRIHLAESR